MDRTEVLGTNKDDLRASAAGAFRADPYTEGRERESD